MPLSDCQPHFQLYTVVIFLSLYQEMRGLFLPKGFLAVLRTKEEKKQLLSFHFSLLGLIQPALRLLHRPEDVDQTSSWRLRVHRLQCSACDYEPPHDGWHEELISWRRHSCVFFTHGVSECVSFQLCFVTVVCSEGLKTKCQLFYLNSSFLYQTFIGCTDGVLGVENIEILSSFTVL